MALKLPTNQFRVLTSLAEATDPVLISALADELSIDQSLVAAAVVALEELGLAATEEDSVVELQLTPEGEAAAGEPLIERRIAEALRAAAAPLALPDVAGQLGIPPGDVGKSLRFLMAKGYATKAGKDLAFAPDADLGAETADEALLARVAEAEGELVLSAAEAADNNTAGAVKDLRARGFIKTRDRRLRRALLTPKGRETVTGGVEEAREETQLTEAMLLDGSWRDVTFRAYDVSLDVTDVHPARLHPLRRVLEETRQAFFRLGFKEIRGHYVESAFWDFDALYQPQDHPARDMQDTFYCARPSTFTLPPDELVDAVRRTHEDGGDTGSTGWRYTWSPDRARQVVLRTHTTAVTVAACHDNPKPPQKVFCVGRVFRRETVDYKHLPEFYQVDGIIVDEDASLATLLGLLGEFYRQMGFEAVRFKPDFFPYTEPSVEVSVRLAGRNEWFELGGAGVFRPEVVEPAGVDVPVLAWGLGLERLAMLRYGVKDIRELYISHLDWLKESAACR